MNKMKYIILFVLASVLVVSGCDNSKDNAQNIESVSRKEAAVSKSEIAESVTETKDADLECKLNEINDEIKETLKVTDSLDMNVNGINILYGISPEDIKQCAGFSVAQGTFPHEIVMIEASDEEAASRIEKAFETKITSFTEQSKNYDAQNYALAKKCKIIKNGNYYALFLSPDYEDVKAIYTKYIK